MKHLLSICVLAATTLTGNAQTEIDNFTVGPYTVDYNGPGDIKYRLRDNINLYEFFELQKDTTIVSTEIEVPVNHAFEIAGRVGANRYASKEIGLEGVWKQSIGEQLYFNGGLSLTIGHTNSGKHSVHRNMFEIGVPLQIELGKLNHQRASLYGSFGIAPTFYSTMNASWWNGEEREDETKKSGFMISPSLEFGGNIPVGDIILRIGVYGTYKINCTSSDYDVCKQSGHMFLGAKIGIVI